MNKLNIESHEKALKKVCRANMRQYAYYYQEKRVPDLGISTPPKIKNIKQSVSWPTLAVDNLLERSNFQGYYSPRKEDQEIVEILNNVVKDNFLNTELTAALRDAMITGAAYLSVGEGDEEKGEARVLIRAESPTKAYGFWNHREHRLDSIFRLTNSGTKQTAIFITPDKICTLVRDKANAPWTLVSEEENHWGEVPYAFIPNQADSENPLGRSVISPTIRNVTDSALRTLLGVEVMREYFTQPIRAITGLNPEDFFDDDGNQKSIYDMIAGGMLALPYDEINDKMPQLAELSASSPSALMDQLEGYAKTIASEIGVAPSRLGYETANPTSAEAMLEMDRKTIFKVNAQQPIYSRALLTIARLILKALDVEADLHYIDTLWEDPEVYSPSVQADTMSKWNAAGIFETIRPDFVYRKLGMSETDIKQLKEYIAGNQANTMLTALLEGQTAAQIITPEPQEEDLSDDDS